MSEASAGSPGRIRSLDGLRGIAAFIVVIHHSLLVLPAFSDAYLRPTVKQRGLDALMIYTPAHVVWAGTEAVYLFFVLSGFVLVRPFVNPGGGGRSWAAYYPQRLIRLYVPIIASVGFAVAIARLAPRRVFHSASGWLRYHHDHYAAGTVLRDMVAIKGGGATNTVLWSMQWEIMFSLALPLFVLFVRVGRRWLPLKVASLCAALLVAHSAHGVLVNGLLSYMPMFGLGALLAAEAAGASRVVARFDSATRGTRAAVLAVLLVAVTVRWPIAAGPVLPGGSRLVLLIQSLAMAVIVAGFAWTTVGRRIGTNRIIGWLGTRSFSLYLVHEPIVVSCAFTLRTTDPLLVFVVAVPLALLATEAFYRVVEAPSHALSRAVPRVLGLSPRTVAAR